MATTANVVKFKRSAVADKIPATADLNLGEIALNTYDGRVYLKKSVASIESIVTLEQLPANLRGYTFPAGQGNAGQVLTTNGDGTLTWATVSGGGEVSVGTNPPVISTTGTLWWDNVDGNLYVKYNGTWVKTISSSTFPTATTSTLGGVKVDGTSVTINGSGVISSTLTSAGITTALGFAPVSQEDAFVAAIIMG